ncbi:MAG: hypothetical protein CH6_0797 [Candidatus Kapaibacterium sp.]|nr:MAG: hypothetical protein CH6_0797 [Candidatus Kapabacteria bacterium]
MKALLYTFLLVFVFNNCQSKQIEKNKMNSKPTVFEHYAYVVDKGDFKKYLIYIKKASPRISKIDLFLPEECFTKCEGKRIDFAKTPIETNDEYQVAIPAWFFTVETKKNLGNENCEDLIFVANKIEYPLKFNIIQTNEKFKSFPQILIHDDTTFLFVLDLLRLKPEEGEYFPTSERLRIEIRNKQGKTIWNSDFDLNFLQVIGKVEPEEVGKIHRYIVPWNRRDNSGKFIEKGDFEVAFILPIKPTNILNIMELSL